jgi:hypothetical protein
MHPSPHGLKTVDTQPGSQSGSHAVAPITRRSALAMLGATAAGLATAHAQPFLGLQPDTQPAAQPLAFILSADPMRPLFTVPATYTGLSYESEQLTHPAFFEPENDSLISLVRTLGRRGVLRIGGNTSAYTAFMPGAFAASTDASGAGPDIGGLARQTRPMQQPGMYKITPKAIDNLAGFLQQTGWQLLYGLNLRHGTPESAAEEAAYVARACGNHLLAFQFGNEPDLFRHDEGSATQIEADKKPLWGYDLFLQKWQAMYKAVHARVPGAPIAGPDSAYRPDWGPRFLNDTKGLVSLITSHYYAEGPPSDPRMSIDYLLHPGQRLDESVFVPLQAAEIAKLPYRMSEGNSCYQGGKAGVSNTFASALWAGDFMLSLAARGCTGVNLHGGGEGCYTPIATAHNGANSARPDFYGMWLAGQFAGTTLVYSRLLPAAGGSADSTAANVTAYVANVRGAFSDPAANAVARRIPPGISPDPGAVLVAVFNKGPHSVAITLQGTPSHGTVYSLTAPSISSTDGVSFGTPQPAQLNPSTASPMRLNGNGSVTGGKLEVPPYSAVLLRLF